MLKHPQPLLSSVCIVIDWRIIVCSCCDLSMWKVKADHDWHCLQDNSPKATLQKPRRAFESLGRLDGGTWEEAEKQRGGEKGLWRFRGISDGLQRRQPAHLCHQEVLLWTGFHLRLSGHLHRSEQKFLRKFFVLDFKTVLYIHGTLWSYVSEPICVIGVIIWTFRDSDNKGLQECLRSSEAVKVPVMRWKNDSTCWDWMLYQTLDFLFPLCLLHFPNFILLAGSTYSFSLFFSFLLSSLSFLSGNVSSWGST